MKLEQPIRHQIAPRQNLLVELKLVAIRTKQFRGFVVWGLKELRLWGFNL